MAVDNMDFQIRAERCLDRYRPTPAGEYSCCPVQRGEIMGKAYEHRLYLGQCERTQCHRKEMTQ